MSVYFNSKKSEWSWLSNFFLSTFVLDGKEYPSVEHWFQSQKFTDVSLQEQIRLAKSPASAKQLGKKRHPSFQIQWDILREEILIQGLRAKFQQNNELRDKLLATNSLELIEDSFWDAYWGNGRSGRGKNRMGILLMRVRSELS